MSVTVPTLSHWECGYQEPSFKDLIALCKYFDVSVDYLLGRTDDFNHSKETSVNDALLSTTEKELISAYRTSSNLGKNRINEYAELIKNNFHKL